MYMKVLLINGSPHEKGCTFTALNNMAWLLKSIAEGNQPAPTIEPFKPTHFIRD